MGYFNFNPLRIKEVVTVPHFKNRHYASTEVDDPPNIIRGFRYLCQGGEFQYLSHIRHIQCKILIVDAECKVLSRILNR
jgi:hypothetical protein